MCEKVVNLRSRFLKRTEMLPQPFVRLRHLPSVAAFTSLWFRVSRTHLLFVLLCAVFPLWRGKMARRRLIAELQCECASYTLQVVDYALIYLYFTIADAPTADAVFSGRIRTHLMHLSCYVTAAAYSHNQSLVEQTINIRLQESANWVRSMQSCDLGIVRSSR